MNKRVLTAIKKLKATPKMMKMAAEDIPEKKSYWLGAEYEIYKCGIYMRCAVQEEILKVAFFFPNYMRMGSSNPVYELYCSKKTGQFLTYDCLNKKWRTAKLDCMDWPCSNSYESKRWISEKDDRTIQKYLGGCSGGYKGILEFQRKIRSDELIRRHKKETDKWDKDLERIRALPRDWNRWVNKVGIVENYLFYDYKKGGAKKGYCTYCGKEVPISGHPYHNKAGKCFRCHHEVTFKAIGRAGSFSTKENYMYLIQACEGGFAVREFYARRIYRKDEYESPAVYCKEYRRVLYDDSLTSRVYYWGLYKQCETRWIAGAPSRPSYWGREIGRVYGKTLPHLARKELKKTGLTEWLAGHKTTDPEDYLAVLKAVPQFEQIWKSGLQQLTKECIQGSYFFRDCILNPEQPSLIKALGIDSQEFKRLRQYDGDTRFLEWLQYEKATQKIIPDNMISWFSSEGIRPKNLDFISTKMSVTQIYNYIRRQMPKFHNRSQEVLDTWADYLSMAERLHMNTDDEIIYRVKKLRQRHDELVKRYQEKKDELQIEDVMYSHPHVNEICKSLKDKYEYSDQNYMILAPEGVAAIIKEGRALNHCVSSVERYWERIESQESFILFLRKRKQPDKSYYTLEIEPDGTIRQKRTEFDRQNSDIEKATTFLTEWQQVVASRLTGADLKMAEKSRIMRAKEFEQLKEDKVIIHTGQLAGKPLLEVLLADLMENTEVIEPQSMPEAA